MIDARVFEASLNHAQGIPVIDLSGEINGSAQALLDRVYEQAQSTGASSILLNFQNVAYINSTGIALIVGLLGRARKSGLILAACYLSHHYQQIFEITRLSQFIRVFPDLQSALSELSQQ